MGVSKSCCFCSSILGFTELLSKNCWFCLMYVPQQELLWTPRGMVGHRRSDLTECLPLTDCADTTVCRYQHCVRWRVNVGRIWQNAFLWLTVLVRQNAVTRFPTRSQNAHRVLRSIAPKTFCSPNIAPTALQQNKRIYQLREFVGLMWVRVITRTTRLRVAVISTHWIIFVQRVPRNSVP